MSETVSDLPERVPSAALWSERFVLDDEGVHGSVDGQLRVVDLRRAERIGLAFEIRSPPFHAPRRELRLISLAQETLVSQLRVAIDQHDAPTRHAPLG